jgi:hypothetical protein
VARPTWGSLFEPRHKQNLYANPKRTAKSFTHYTDIDGAGMQMVQKKFQNVFGRQNARFYWQIRRESVLHRAVTSPAAGEYR